MRADVALVTGGNSGIGFECARSLARAGWHVAIASRDRSASAAAVARIARESGADAASELGLDLGSFASVRQLAREVESKKLPIRALVCNAGLQATSLRRTEAGHELTFGVNHLGHFLLANLLLERLRAAGNARIVVVASGVHDPAMKTGMPKAAIGDLATLAATGGPTPDRFDGRLAYVNSKLCNLWFAYELVRRIDAAALTSGALPLTVKRLRSRPRAGLRPRARLPGGAAVRLGLAPSGRRARPVAAPADDQPREQGGGGARASRHRPDAGRRHGEVLSVALALARGALVGRVLRRGARTAALGREHPAHGAPPRRVAAAPLVARQPGAGASVSSQVDGFLDVKLPADRIAVGACAREARRVAARRAVDFRPPRRKAGFAVRNG
jgi:NAD(P)-dependent dehydrogenase (short-subunit alcohol dehydrogenase family)